MTDLETNALKQQAKDLLRQMPIKNGKLVGVISYLQRKLVLQYRQAWLLAEALEVDGFMTQADDAGHRTLREWEVPKPVDEPSCLLGLPHIKEEGSDRCPSCGCPVKDFLSTTCTPPMRGNGDGI